ncbi:MAG TPA: glycosyltransferase family 87 protein [Polyangia bacterium]|nr:glycosyltransferase family 87 protein [Polyangia bacterium]
MPAGRLLLAVYQIVAVIVSVPLLVRGLRLLVDHVWTSNGWGDGRVDWGGAQLFLKGQSPYSVEGLHALGLEQYGFGHPPTTPFWFIPLAPFTVVVMAQILAALALLALLVHIVICVEELRFPSRLITVLLVFSLVVGTPWMIEHFHVLQISEFIALAYVLAWHHLRRDREISAGICIGLACTLKLFPGLMVIYLLLARRWRAVFAAIASYLPVAIIMTTGYGLRSWPQFFLQQGHIADTWIGHIRNASVHGIVLRLLTPTCVARAAPKTAGTLLATLAAVLVLAFAWWVTRRELRDRQRFDLSFALFTLVSAFLNAWIWEHYRVLLILPLLLAIRTIADAAVDGWRRRAGAPQERPAARYWLGIALGGLVVATSMFSLTDGVWDKEVALRDYRRSAGMAAAVRHALHVRLHYLEVMNWLPWVLAIALLACLLSWRRRTA